MLNDLDILRTAAAMARHAAARQELIARNISNADTPGFKAMDLESFGEAFKRDVVSKDAQSFESQQIVSLGTTSPNGNTVSLEDQMWRSAESARQHETALTLYSKSLALLRTALGNTR